MDVLQFKKKTKKKQLFYGVEPSRGVFFLMPFDIIDGEFLQKAWKLRLQVWGFWMQVLEGPAGLQGPLKVWVFARSFLKKKLDTENRAFVAREPDSCQPQVFGLLPPSAALFLIW